MVLSNKKQKQKLRAAKAESLAAAEQGQNHSTKNDSTNPEPNLQHTQQPSLKSLLGSMTQKPKLSKREKRRGNAVSLQEVGAVVNESSGDSLKRKNEEDGSEGDGVNEQRKSKKRKRGEGVEAGDLKNMDVEKPKKSKRKKKKKKKKKKKGNKGKKVESESENKVVERELGASGEGAVEAIHPIDSQENVNASKKIYVGGIPYYSTEDDIRSYFEGCGTITEVDCMTFPESGKFRGIAIISFKTEAATKRALALDGADMGGLFLKIQPYKSTKVNKVSDFAPAIVEGYNRVYVGNLSWDITEDELKKLFSDCKITSIRFGEDRETGEFRGYAHVDFADSLSLTVALKLDQKIVCGRPVRISCAVPWKKATANNSKYLPAKTPVAADESKSLPRNEKNPATENKSASLPTSEKTPATENESESLPTSEKTVDSNVSAVSGKIRRRTCYECGDRGHISSSCPKKATNDPVNSIAT